MQSTKRSLIRLLAPLCLGLALGSTAALADDYPSKPVRIIVPYTPGGFNDTLARTVGDRLGKLWKQSVVVTTARAATPCWATTLRPRRRPTATPS